MTIPTLMTKIQIIQLRNQLKQTYSELNQVAMQFMEDNDEDIPGWTRTNEYKHYEYFWRSDSGIGKYIKGFTKVAENFREMTADTNTKYPYKLHTLDGSPAENAICDVSPYYIDAKGRLYIFDNIPERGYNGPRVCVDINGIKGPNVPGIDIFNFFFTVDGHVIPEGHNHPNNNYTSEIYFSGSRLGNNYCKAYYSTYFTINCAFYALNDQSPKGNGTYWNDFIGKKQYK